MAPIFGFTRPTAPMLRNFIWDGCKDIEVVPRKMVEMIIERCVRDMCSASNDGAMCYEASCIKDYAESLLKRFEEDKE